MKFRVTLFLAAAVFAIPAVRAADSPYQTATLLDVQQQVQRTPRSWLWDTPVTFDEVVSYELSFRIGNTSYTSEYIPDVQPNGPIPAEWKPGNQLDIRIQKHALFVKLSYDGEIETHVTRRHLAKTP
jgi:hypothetical protein